MTDSNRENQQASLTSNPADHERWLAETWEMIEECARATQGDRRRTVVTLSPEGCAALLAERRTHETADEPAAYLVKEPDGWRYLASTLATAEHIRSLRGGTLVPLYERPAQETPAECPACLAGREHDGPCQSTLPAFKLPLRTALEFIRDGAIPQDMSPALFAERVLSLADAIPAPKASEKRMCPAPFDGKNTVRECIDAGQCGCYERDSEKTTGEQS